ncbi:hypothetical protein Tco_0840030 [Tanacetum coccineum]|uniref:Uncharacterized protein n=1 Tax=Tanacetum coccineum TaxID=301880 RepID=A0ABQ5AWE1_9ASTR
MRNEIKVKKELVPFDLPNVNSYDEPTKEQEDEAQAFRLLESLKRETHEEEFKLLLARKHFKSELIGYHAEDDDGIIMIVDVARGRRLEAWLEHAVSSSYRANLGESSVLILLFSLISIFLMYNRDIVQTKWGKE